MQDEHCCHHHLHQQQTKNVGIQGKKKKSTCAGFPEFLWAVELLVLCCVIFQATRIKANKDDLQILVAIVTKLK